MGSITSDLQGSTFANKLTYIENVNDKRFGSIDIYRTKEAPFQYIMDYKKCFIEDNNRLSKYLEVVNKLKNMEHRNLAKLHHSQLVERNQLCVKNSMVHTFSNYYNFTLEEAIDKKKNQDSCFHQNQLVYIMWCLIDLAIFLQAHNLSVGEYRSQSIFLSPEGYIKMFMIEADEQNQHSCYYKVLIERSLTQNYIFSPQQLQCLNNMEYQIKYNVQKADVFAIGILMLQLVTLDKSKFYYNSEKTGLKMDRIVFDLSSMSSYYSQDFINLLRCCLNPIAQDRFTYQEAYNEILRIKKRMKGITNCIRLQDDECKGKRNQKTRDYNKKTSKGELWIKGVQKKLTPTPVSVTPQNPSYRNTGSTLTDLNLLTLGGKTQSTIKL